MSTEQEQQKNQWASQLDDIVRGASGGFLFSIPLLYTMEVWFIGTSADPPHMMIMLLTTIAVVFLLNVTSGFHKLSGGLLKDVVQTIQAVGMSLLFTALVLFILRRFTLETPPTEIVGKVIFESFPFALGVSIGNQMLSSKRSGDGGQQGGGQQGQPGGEQQSKHGLLNATVKDLGATAIGGLFIGLTVAPTEEIPMLAAAITPPWLFVLMILSLLISYGIVFESGFANAKQRKQQHGILQRPISETVAAYLVSLAVSAFMLAMLDHVTFNDPWHVWLNLTIVLGLVTTVGGSAGRIAV
ncbi:MAG: TIGR02587 family membrane protein [Chloroflexota bacterium]|nr:TIGR02587 family membrane protein [Chloroflexota bacterium]